MSPPSDALKRFDSEYLAPLKEYATSSYEHSPIATMTAIIFAISSVTPIVAAIALATFTICFSLATCLIVFVAIGAPSSPVQTLVSRQLSGLSLVVFLCATAVSSTVLAVFVLVLTNIGKRQRSASTHSEATLNTDPAPEARKPWRRFPRLRVPSSASPRRRWFRAAFFIVTCEFISRLRLPRAVRYSFLYRTFLGVSLFAPRGQRGHGLQCILSLPFFLTRRVWTIVSFFLRLSLSRPVLVLALGILLLSPGLRRATSKRMWRFSRTAGVHFRGSELEEAVRRVPWRQIASTMAKHGDAAIHRALDAFSTFLHEENNAESPPQPRGKSGSTVRKGQMEDPQDDATSLESYEVVAPTEAASSTSTLCARTSQCVEE